MPDIEKAIESNGAIKKAFTGFKDALNPKNAISATANEFSKANKIVNLTKGNDTLKSMDEVIHHSSSGNKDALTESMDNMWKNSGHKLEEGAHASTGNINEVVKGLGIDNGKEQVDGIFNEKGELNQHALDLTKGTEKNGTSGSNLNRMRKDTADRIEEVKKETGYTKDDDLKTANASLKKESTELSGEGLKTSIGAHVGAAVNYFAMKDVDEGSKLLTGAIRYGTVGAGIGGVALTGHALFGDHNDGQ